MAELVDALDSKSSAARRAGSIPAPGTKEVLYEELPFLFNLDSALALVSQLIGFTSYPLLNRQFVALFFLV